MKKMYKVVYFDDDHKQHWRFTDSLVEIKFIKDRFGITEIEALNN